MSFTISPGRSRLISACKDQTPVNTLTSESGLQSSQQSKPKRPRHHLISSSVYPTNNSDNHNTTSLPSAMPGSGSRQISPISNNDGRMHSANSGSGTKNVVDGRSGINAPGRQSLVVTGEGGQFKETSHRHHIPPDPPQVISYAAFYGVATPKDNRHFEVGAFSLSSPSHRATRQISVKSPAASTGGDIAKLYGIAKSVAGGPRHRKTHDNLPRSTSFPGKPKKTERGSRSSMDDLFWDILPASNVPVYNTNLTLDRLLNRYADSESETKPAVNEKDDKELPSSSDSKEGSLHSTDQPCGAADKPVAPTLIYRQSEGFAPGVAFGNRNDIKFDVPRRFVATDESELSGESSIRRIRVNATDNERRGLLPLTPSGSNLNRQRKSAMCKLKSQRLSESVPIHDHVEVGNNIFYIVKINTMLLAIIIKIAFLAVLLIASQSKVRAVMGKAALFLLGAQFRLMKRLFAFEEGLQLLFQRPKDEFLSQQPRRLSSARPR